MSEVLKHGKTGLATLGSSVLFFYSHLSLLFVSLIPSLSRAFQMWMAAPPIWIEGILGLARVFLFVLMIRLLTGRSIRELLAKDVWEELIESCSATFRKHWPAGFISQLVVFIIVLFGLGNGLIFLLSGLFVPTLEWIGMQPADQAAASDAAVYFLKNMSVIPVAIVFVLKMCGVKKPA